MKHPEPMRMRGGEAKMNEDGRIFMAVRVPSELYSKVVDKATHRGVTFQSLMIDLLAKWANRT